MADIDHKTAADIAVTTSLKQPGVEEPQDPAASKKYGTQYDRRDMNRMGRRQQLRRNFRFLSIFGYAVILGSTWEFALVVAGISTLNGGPAGAIWLFFITCIGMFFVTLSMAEMASMAPTSGGQYHWVSEFAPRKYQKFISYIVGWLCVLGWQSGMATTAYATAQQFEAIIALNVPSYKIMGWQGTLFSIAITLFAIIFNTILIRKLPLFEGIILILHVFGFIAFMTVLWVMSPRADVHTTWTDFQDNAGWGNLGLATLVGILGPTVTLVGGDSACHLSEELRDAAWVLPRSMIVTAVVNYSLGFIMTVTIMTTLGDLSTDLATNTGQVYVQVLLNATQSRVGTSILTAVMAILLLFCAVNNVTTSSRQLFAFSRDKGLPFSKWLSTVPDGWDIPVNAVMTTLLFTTLLSLIIIGSPIAFNVITSLTQVGLISSYIIAISCMAVRRFSGRPLLPSRFNLGKAGLFVNCAALTFLSVAYVFLFFPAAPHPTPAAMNWSCLIYAVVLMISLLYYFFIGRHTYEGPVEYVRKDV